METKTCMYCNKTFTKADFPRTFHRMVTCGDVACAEKRRVELWQARYQQWKATRVLA